MRDLAMKITVKAENLERYTNISPEKKYIESSICMKTVKLNVDFDLLVLAT
jgi:hypothetical protein